MKRVLRERPATMVTLTMGMVTMGMVTMGMITMGMIPAITRTLRR